MKKIYKYDLGEDGNVVSLRGNFSRILDIQTQGYNPRIWMEIDDSYPEVEINIVAIGTGWEIPKEYEYWHYVKSTIVGPFVWHYYVDKNEFFNEEMMKIIDKFNESNNLVELFGDILKS